MPKADDLAICETCGGVEPINCSTCPAVYAPVTVGMIRQAFRDAPDNASLQDAWKRYKRHIATLKVAGGVAFTMSIQLRNLEAYRRGYFANGGWQT